MINQQSKVCLYLLDIVIFIILYISVESPAPSKSSLNIIPGPTHITLDWGAPQEGWVTSYKIHVEPSKVMNIWRALLGIIQILRN